jgi:hypothetical protein
MGQLWYGSSNTPIEIEDEALAHLKLIIITKLRRDESFTISWTHPTHQARGRSTIWLHPSIPIRFVFDTPDPCEVDPERLEEMAASAHSTGGIQVKAEYFEIQAGDVASTVAMADTTADRAGA